MEQTTPNCSAELYKAKLQSNLETGYCLKKKRELLKSPILNRYIYLSFCNWGGNNMPPENPENPPHFIILTDRKVYNNGRIASCDHCSDPLSYDVMKTNTGHN